MKRFNLFGTGVSDVVKYEKDIIGCLNDYFDELYYARRYNVTEGGFNHFLKYGLKGGMSPSAFFSAEHYRREHGLKEESALEHYLANWQDLAFCSPAFDQAGYLEMYPDVRKTGHEPLHHFINFGLREGRLPGFALTELPERKRAFPDFDWPSFEAQLLARSTDADDRITRGYRALVDQAFYMERYGRHVPDGDCLRHYRTIGWSRGFRPNRHFDPVWYVAQHRIGSNIDPLLHHVTTSSRPTPYFCAKSYLRANPDLLDDLEAFAYFVRSGAHEGRPLGITAGALVALRALSPDYDWSGMDETGLFAPPVPPQGTVFATTQPLPAPRIEPDALQVATYQQKASSARLISFDIWDTLLRRNCHPDAVKLHAAEVMLHHLRRLDRATGVTAAGLMHLRQLAEWRVADAEYEYRHAAMLEEWLGLAGVSDPIQARLVTDELLEAEVAFELQVTRVDPTGRAMLEALPDTPKIAISDFYLSGKEVHRLLAHHGLDRHFRAIYVSSDVLKTKRAGSLFGHVLAQEGLKPGDVLHVGDNPEADWDVPARLGINTLLYRDSDEDRRKVVFQQHYEAQLAGDGAALLAGTLRLLGLTLPGIEKEKEDRPSRSGTNNDSDAEVSHARHSLRPASQPAVKLSDSRDLLTLGFLGFGLFVLDRAMARGAKTVFFATREGLFLRRVCDRLIAFDALPRGLYPATAIIEVSRRATFAPSLNEISIPEMMRLWSQYSVQSMGALGRSLNLDETQLELLCLQHDIDPAEDISHPWLDPRVNALFDDPAFREWSGRSLLAQKQVLCEYLSAAGFNPAGNDNRFLVDIGWRGTIQDNLARMVNGRIEGIYLALEQFLNRQANNVVKHGFLADHNADDDRYRPGDFAALELIANGPGGSVIGYADGAALRETFAAEEHHLTAHVLPLQDEIVDRIEHFWQVLGTAPIGLESWRVLAREAFRLYVSCPDADIAGMVQQLQHNETFGTGEVQDIGHSIAELASDDPAAFHAALTKRIDTIRWPEAWTRSPGTQSALAALPLEHRLAIPRRAGLVSAPALIRSRGENVAIYSPAPIIGSGGHRTIYKLARAFDAAGYTVDLFSESRGEFEYKEQELAGTSVSLHDSWYTGLKPTAAVATINYSAKYIRELLPEDVAKFYFVQDMESSFNPLGDRFLVAENSYALGLNTICVGRWMPHVLRRQYGHGAASGGLGADTTFYRPFTAIERKTKPPRSNAIAVLYQPEKGRRSPELCLHALNEVKRQRPDIDVIFYGSHDRPHTNWRSTHLGLVDDLNVLNTLYNTAKVGLCVSLTNPSRIPFEMMAAGCVPVDVYRYNTLFDYPDGTGLLAYQSAESLAAAMLHLLDDEDARRARSARCIEVGAVRTLDWEMDCAVNAVEFCLGGGSLQDLSLPAPTYSDPAFVAQSDQTDSVLAWCEWQAFLAKAGSSDMAPKLSAKARV